MLRSTRAGTADPVTEQVHPVLLVASLGLGEPEQDLALLAGPPAGQRAVRLRLGAFLGQVAPPAAQVSFARGRGRGKCS